MRRSVRARPLKTGLDQRLLDAGLEFRLHCDRVQLPRQLGRIVRGDPVSECVVAATVVIGQAEDSRLVPRVALPRLALLRWDPARCALRLPPLPKLSRAGGRFKEVHETPRETLHQVAVRAPWLGSIPAHHLTNDRPHTVLIHSPLLRTARALQPPIERNTARAAEQGSSPWVTQVMLRWWRSARNSARLWLSPPTIGRRFESGTAPRSKYFVPDSAVPQRG
jgi:hypothetical protein